MTQEAGFKEKKKFRFSEEKALRVIRFFENYLFHIKGKWSGQPFKLLPWQKEELIKPLFGMVDENGLRQFRTAFVFLPRKNGKSTLAAGIALYMLCADGEAGAEVYSAANDRDQARIVFDTARRMVEASPVLRKHLQVYKNVIVHEKSSSFYKVISADAYTKHGYNAHCVIYDELHAAKDRELWDVLSTSTAARTQPLVFVITTAGTSFNSICYELYDYALKVRDGIIKDDRFFSLIYQAERDDDWQSEETWKKANPSLGETLSVEYLKERAEQAKHMPTAQASFKRLHLNIWVNEQNKWIDMKLWDENDKGKVDDEYLAKLPCWAGLDISAVSDITAFVMIFKDDDGTIHVKPRFFAPLSKIKDEANKLREQYRAWAEEGYLTLIEGDVIDLRVVKEEILKEAERFRISSINIDRLFQGHQTALELEEAGLNVFGMGQGFLSMSIPAKEFERLLQAKKLNHMGNPVLKWMASNAVAKTDPAGNVKPDKANSEGKIDGIVALIMAIDRMIREEGAEESVYNERGILLL